MGVEGANTVFGASIVVNRVLKPVKDAVGEAAGEIVADLAGATGGHRTRIIDNTRRVVNIGGSIVVANAMGDVGGVADVIDALDT
jgi:hypothetical protein